MFYYTKYSYLNIFDIMNGKLILVSLLALTGALILLATNQSTGVKSELNSLMMSKFAGFRSHFGKEYSSIEELEYRLTVFQSNVNLIEAHNSDASSTYTLAVNEFTDLTYEEFSAKYLGHADQLERAARCEKTGLDNAFIGNDARKVVPVFITQLFQSWIGL